jgi:hypothetical protein
MWGTWGQQNRAVAVAPPPPPTVVWASEDEVIAAARRRNNAPFPLFVLLAVLLVCYACILAGALDTAGKIETVCGKAAPAAGVMAKLARNLEDRVEEVLAPCHVYMEQVAAQLESVSHAADMFESRVLAAGRERDSVELRFAINAGIEELRTRALPLQYTVSGLLTSFDGFVQKPDVRANMEVVFNSTRQFLHTARPWVEVGQQLSNAFGGPSDAFEQIATLEDSAVVFLAEAEIAADNISVTLRRASTALERNLAVRLSNAAGGDAGRYILGMSMTELLADHGANVIQGLGQVRSVFGVIRQVEILIANLLSQLDNQLPGVQQLEDVMNQVADEADEQGAAVARAYQVGAWVVFGIAASTVAASVLYILYARGPYEEHLLRESRAGGARDCGARDCCEGTTFWASVLLMVSLGSLLVFVCCFVGFVALLKVMLARSCDTAPLLSDDAVCTQLLGQLSNASDVPSLLGGPGRSCKQANVLLCEDMEDTSFARTTLLASAVGILASCVVPWQLVQLRRDIQESGRLVAFHYEQERVVTADPSRQMLLFSPP